MIEIFLDFETRSESNARDIGASKYSKLPRTTALMLAYGRRGDRRQWLLDLEAIRSGFTPPCPDDLVHFIAHDEYEFHAHNAAFEIYIWENVCVARWGWPSIPLSRWYCTAAKGCAANMPRALGNLCERIGITDGKDSSGKALINRLSIPQKALTTKKIFYYDENGERVKEENEKGRLVFKKVDNPRCEAFLSDHGVELFEGKDPKAKYYFDEDPDAMAAFARYNLTDIEAEENCDRWLPKLDPIERKLWILDRKINMRGIPVDRELCEGAIKAYAVEVEKAHEEIAEVAYDEEVEAGKQVTKCSQRQRIVDWLNKRVNFGDSLSRDTVEEWLRKKDLRPDVKRVLELRQIAGGTAVTKYQAALNFVELDCRCRDQLLYYGAATGRWTGKGLQPHNFARAKTPDETFIRAITTGDHELVEIFAEMQGVSVFQLIKSCVRGIIKAPKGRKFIVSDFAGIESRVLNWLAGNEGKLELFRNQEDTYIHAATDVFGVSFEEITEWSEAKGKFIIQKAHEQKRQVGKACELGLGYGMGANTWADGQAKAGQEVDPAFAEEVVGIWREKNWQVVELWKRLERACKDVIWKKNHKQRPVASIEGKLRIFWKPVLDGKGKRKGFLCIQLPSGRILYYYDAIVDKDTGQILYFDGGKTGRNENGGRIETYGGKLVENVVQAIARDLLVNSMFIIDEAGLDLVFHVHDETVTEVDEDDSTAFDICHRAMETLPEWAAGLPLEAETTEGTRYSK